MPLSHWSAFVDGAQPDDVQIAPPAAYATIARAIEGTFDKGLLSGTLTVTFQVYDEQGYVAVPILETAASPGAVVLNGQPTSLVAQGDMYTLGVSEPGVYEAS